MTSERRRSVQVRTAAYQRVRRLRTELSITFLGWGFLCAMVSEGGLRVGLVGEAQQVAGAATRVEERRVFRAVDFAAKAIYVDFDEVGERVELLVPNVLGDFGAADDAANVTHEKFEQGVFFVGQGNMAAGAGSSLPGRVQGQGFNGELSGLQLERTAQQSAQAGQEFAKLEGLGEIVVGAMVEAGDAVFDGIARSQHEHRNALAVFAEPAANLESA